MADLKVEGLQQLAADLDLLIGEFQGALDLQNERKGTWGQHNANLSMGDFADNWTGSRDKMVEAMKKFRDRVKGVDEAWTQAERDMLNSLLVDK
jgi:hypothetical protein